MPIPGADFGVSYDDVPVGGVYPASRRAGLLNHVSFPSPLELLTQSQLVGGDGFDMYNGTGTNIGLQSKWALFTGANGGNCLLIGGRFGGQALRLGPNGTVNTNTTVRTNLAGTFTSMAIGFAYRTFNFNVVEFFALQLNAGSQISIRQEANGSFSVWTGDVSAFICQSGPSAYNLNTWAYIELEIYCHNTAGRVNLYVNGGLVASASNVNTRAQSSVGFNQIVLSTSGNSGLLIDVDDLYYTNVNTRLGELKVETIRPASDSVVAWTPNSGTTNFSRVNETLVDGDTSYVSTIGLGVRDLYALGSLSGEPTTIYGLQVVMFAEKTDAGTRSLYGSITSAGVQSDGPKFQLGSGYSRYDRAITLDPGTSGPFTFSAVNSLLVGPTTGA